MTSIIHPRLFDMLARFYPDKCTIIRETPGAEDPLGGPSEPTTTTVIDAQACRFMAKDEVITSDDKTQSQVVTRYTIDLPLASADDVRERDVVSEIVRADGSTLSNAFTVKSILNYRESGLQYSVIDLERPT